MNEKLSILSFEMPERKVNLGKTDEKNVHQPNNKQNKNSNKLNYATIDR